jgi:hypothetical protein
VQPGPIFATPPAPRPTEAPKPTLLAPTDAYAQGWDDRDAWEKWFQNLTGDYGAGAASWAARRSGTNPGTCKGTNAAEMSTEWQSGCAAAQQRLERADELRRTESDYREGWNAWKLAGTTKEGDTSGAEQQAPE